jgi:hypothetical protein
MQEQDFPSADFHLPGRTVGEEHNAGRHLLGKPQHIRGVCAGGLESDGVAHHECASDGIGGRGDSAKHRFMERTVIQSSGKLTNHPFGFEPLES